MTAPTTILVVGRSGQLARSLAEIDWPAALRPVFAGRERLDLRRPEAVRAAISEIAPSVVVNAAAYNLVDGAEEEPDAAMALNSQGPAALAEACRRRGAALIHISSDYVFDGAADRPYREDDPVRPLSHYGASKAEGEAAVREALDRHAIVRTSWLFSPFGGNFVKTLLRLGAERDRVDILADQTGCPTAAGDLALALVPLAAALIADRKGATGTFHFCGAEAMSWYAFAERIFAAAAATGRPLRARLSKTDTATFAARARRPAYSALDCGKFARTFGVAPPRLAPALAACLARIFASERTGKALAQ